jgi:general secretion pathway protein G
MRSRGYTLIELLVVLAILGVLAAMSWPMAQMNAEREKERELKRALWQIRDAIDAYKSAKLAGVFGGMDSLDTAPPYPPTLKDLTELVYDARPDHRGETLRFLRSVPRDPFADPTLPADKTWGLRSFDSEADHPRAGTDVYDVYSTSMAVGLNGSALSQW